MPLSGSTILNMPALNEDSTLNLCLNNLGKHIKYITLHFDDGTTDSKAIKLSDGVPQEPFQPASGGSMSLGFTIGFFIEGYQTPNEKIIQDISLSNLHWDENGTNNDFELYDTTAINLSLEERTYSEIGTFVVEDIIIELSVNPNYS